MVQAAGIAIAKPACEGGESAADALGATTAVRRLKGLLAGVRATHALSDQIAASRVSDQVDDLGLGHPKERILDCEGLFNKKTK